MQVMSGRKLLTCRYWAFGPRCPNVDANGVEICEYAHRDTGRLSSFYRQRGTCWNWAHPRLKCHFGAVCSFEHRDTGFMGTHHGILELSGLNLQVADAARNSGFDTRNHVALLDLIWSVRRVAFNHGVTKPSLPPPPKHPIYPDRYRPGAQGNSSKKSLKRAREAEAQAHGTSSNPIDLDVDNSENENQFLIPTATKRQKTAIGLKARSVTTTAASGAPNPVHPSRFPNSRLNTIKTEGKENIPAPRTTYMPSPRSLNPPPPRDSPSARKLHPLALVPAHSGRQRRLFCPRYPLQTFNQQQETFYELRRVSHTLSDNLDAVNNCQRVMKNLYDADSEIRHHDVFDLLLKLRDDMQDSENGILKALRDVDDVIAFLKSGGRDSAIGMDEIE